MILLFFILDEADLPRAMSRMDVIIEGAGSGHGLIRFSFYLVFGELEELVCATDNCSF